MIGSRESVASMWDPARQGWKAGGGWILCRAPKRGETVGYLVLKVFADLCDFPRVLFNRLLVPHLFPKETLAELYTFMYNLFPGERPMHSDNARKL